MAANMTSNHSQYYYKHIPHNFKDLHHPAGPLQLLSLTDTALCQCSPRKLHNAELSIHSAHEETKLLSSNVATIQSLLLYMYCQEAKTDHSYN